MERIEIFWLLIKALLYFALAFIIFGNIYQAAPLGTNGRVVLALIAIMEAIMIIRKIDNRK